MVCHNPKKLSRNAGPLPRTFTDATLMPTFKTAFFKALAFILQRFCGIANQCDPLDGQNAPKQCIQVKSYEEKVKSGQRKYFHPYLKIVMGNPQ